MSKGIVVINKIPNECYNCRFMVRIMGKPKCLVKDVYDDFLEHDTWADLSDVDVPKPDWCPLCEMPERRFEEDFDWTDLTQKENAAMNHGWNKCLKRLEDEDDK